MCKLHYLHSLKTLGVQAKRIDVSLDSLFSLYWQPNPCFSSYLFLFYLLQHHFTNHYALVSPTFTVFSLFSLFFLSLMHYTMICPVFYGQLHHRSTFTCHPLPPIQPPKFQGYRLSRFAHRLVIKLNLLLPRISITQKNRAGQTYPATFHHKQIT